MKKKYLVISFLILAISIFFGLPISIAKKSEKAQTEPDKGFVVHKEKIGNMSFIRYKAGEHVCDAAIIDMNGLTQGVKHLTRVANEMKAGKYGSGDRSQIMQMKRIRTGIDAEISYTARISNARIGDSLMIDIGGETIAEIRAETEGDIIATFYLTSIGKARNEAKMLTNKSFLAGMSTFNIQDVLGRVIPGKNDYVSFTYLPKEENNLANPEERIHFKLLRYEKLKTIVSN
jgi:hypothetical protein